MTQESTQERIASRVEEIVRKQTERNDILSPKTNLKDDLDLDSLELTELAITLEKAFSLPIPDAQVRRCVTLDDIVQLVSRVAAERNAA